MKTNKDFISLLIDIAFEIGKWEGQVELEEHLDKEQYGQCIIESIYAAKTCKPLHRSSDGKQVLVNLRSQAWREGVRKTCNKKLQKLKDNIPCREQSELAKLPACKPGKML